MQLKKFLIMLGVYEVLLESFQHVYTTQSFNSKMISQDLGEDVATTLKETRNKYVNMRWDKHDF